MCSWVLPHYDGLKTYHTALDARTINITGSLVAYDSRSESDHIAFDRHKTISKGIPQPERVEELNKQARSQMEALLSSSGGEGLKFITTTGLRYK